MIGLGNYSFFWQISERAPQALTLPQMLERTRELGGEVFQICDYAPLTGYSAADLRELRRCADDLGLVLELGMRGTAPAQLKRYFELAGVLGARIVRAILFSADYRPPLDEARRVLEAAAVEYAAAGVAIALETYEQLSSTALVSLVEGVGSPGLGICLDPANCVAALEQPREVVERCAPHVLNLHVKDFAFSRRDGWVGFTLSGAALGSGLLDYDQMIATVEPQRRGINRIVEHWLPWQGTFEETRRLEDEWTRTALSVMRERDAQRDSSPERHGRAG